jgi:hypothetical protein
MARIPTIEAPTCTDVSELAVAVMPDAPVTRQVMMVLATVAQLIFIEHNT